MNNVADIPLPYGWVTERDQRTDHPYYIDTRANPPRAIWVHPYEDEQYLSEHPDVREKVGRLRQDEPDVKGQTFKPPERIRHYSFHGEPSSSNIASNSREPTSQPGSPNSRRPKERGILQLGLLGLLKDRANGTPDVKDQTFNSPRCSRRHSSHRESSSSSDSCDSTSRHGSPKSRRHKKKGLLRLGLGLLQDGANGTKEEKKPSRRDMVTMDDRGRQQRSLLMQQQQQTSSRYPQQGGNDYNTYGPPDSNAYDTRRNNNAYGPPDRNAYDTRRNNNAYGPPDRNAYDSRGNNNAYGPPDSNAYDSRGNNNAYGPPDSNAYGHRQNPRNQRGGGGGSGMPLLGGLAGGLLLGDILDI